MLYKLASQGVTRPLKIFHQPHLNHLLQSKRKREGERERAEQKEEEEESYELNFCVPDLRSF